MGSPILIRAQSWWRHLKPLAYAAADADQYAAITANAARPTRNRSRARPRFNQKVRPDSVAPNYVDLFENAPVGYMQLNYEGGIQRINQTGAAILGWSPDWLLGKPFSRWVVNNDKQLFQAHHKQLCSQEQGSSQELRIKNREGRSVTLRLHSTRETDRDTGGYRSIMVDISGDEQSARRLRRLQSQLTHVARVQTAGELATSLAHELNQPLGTVVLNCEAALRMLTSGQYDEHEVAEVLAQAKESATFASRIIRHLRSYLRKGDEQHQVCALPDLILNIIELIDTDARDNDVDLKLDFDTNLPDVRVNAVQIEQVLVNLVHNSIEAMSNNDNVGVKLVSILVRFEAPGDVCVSVTDTGPGLNAKQLTRVFNPFYTTKSHGMGMGLCISRTIIEAHGGLLWADSKGHAGVTIHFTLPTI